MNDTSWCAASRHTEVYTARCSGVWCGDVRHDVLLLLRWREFKRAQTTSKAVHIHRSPSQPPRLSSHFTHWQGHTAETAPSGQATHAVYKRVNGRKQTLKPKATHARSYTYVRTVTALIMPCASVAHHACATLTRSPNR